MWRMFPNPLAGREKKKSLGCRPTPAHRASWVARSARPSSLPLPPPPLVLGSRLPSLTGKTSLEGGLKGLQTDPDRRCLAADVAGWYVTALRSGEEKWGETEVETSDWLRLRVQVCVCVCVYVCVCGAFCGHVCCKGHFALTRDERITAVSLLLWWMIRVMQSTERKGSHTRTQTT